MPSPKLASFRVGDRVELLLFYGFHDEPCPRGTVVSLGRNIHCKMDRNGKAVRFEIMTQHRKEASE
jgi:hypothetical protein